MAWYNKFDQMNSDRRQREINEANRYGTPNGCHQIYGTVTSHRDGKPASFWNSSSDTESGFYNR